jgi:DNA-binding ferritin-like protein (Dps family)
VGIRDIIEGKREWRAHVARVKALPPDYKIVYEESQKYFFKIGPVELADGSLLSSMLDFFEEGVATGKGVRELIGDDVAAFCDDQPMPTSIRIPSARTSAREGNDRRSRLSPARSSAP